MNGYIMLHRQLLEWEWYGDTKVKAVFIDLLLRANFKTAQWRGQEIKRGQVVIGIERFGAKIGLSIQEVKTCLKKLKNTHEITTRATSKFLLVTIVNFELYQSLDNSEQLHNNFKLTQEQLDSNLIATFNQPQRNKENKDNKNNKDNKSKSEASSLQTEPISKKGKMFTPPTIQEVESYCIEKGWKLSFAQVFLDSNLQSNWTLANGRKMKDWKAACRVWMGKEFNFKYIDKSAKVNQISPSVSYDQIQDNVPANHKEKYFNTLARALRTFFKDSEITDAQKAKYQVLSSPDFSELFKLDHPKIFKECLEKYHEIILKSL